MSGLDREAVRLLARPRTPVDRLRSRATAAAAAGTGVALMLVAAVVGLGDDPSTTGVVRTASPDGSTKYTVVTPTDGLVAFVADPGLRPGVELGALLLVLPFVALAVQALRTGTAARQQREATLVVAGASQRDLRRVRVSSTAVAAARGGLWAAPAYLVTWLLLGLAPPPGARLVPAPEPWLALVWVALVGLLAAAGALAGALLGRRGGRARPAPSARAAWAWAAGAAGCLGVVVLFSLLPFELPREWDLPVVLALLLAALLAVAGCAVVVLTRAALRPTTRRATRRLERAARSGAGAEAVLAAAQRRANPVAVGASGAVLVLVGLCLGVCVAFVSVLAVSRRYDGREVAFYGGGAALAGAVAGLAAVVALVSLALALSDHLGQARRAVASTAALGCDLPRLVEVQARALAATAVPCVGTGTLLGGLSYGGLLAAADGMWSEPRTLVPLGVVLAAAVVVAAGARLVCCAVAELLTGRVRRAAALENLRTP